MLNQNVRTNNHDKYDRLYLHKEKLFIQFQSSISGQISTKTAYTQAVTTLFS